MGKSYENFYENMTECQYRLNNSMVLYDGDPYLIFAITEYKTDNIFRVYLWPVETVHKLFSGDLTVYRYTEYTLGTVQQAEFIDTWLETDVGKSSGVLRKHINSPAFNKFRPFPLGMINKSENTYYLERSPQRHRSQGLSLDSIYQTPVTIYPRSMRNAGRCTFNPYGPEMKDCIKGYHPSLRECLEKFKDPVYEPRASVAFHRECALVRGPLDTIFLGVRGDIVGVVSNDRTATLAHKFKYLKETVEDTNSFIEVKVQEKEKISAFY